MKSVKHIYKQLPFITAIGHNKNAREASSVPSQLTIYLQHARTGTAKSRWLRAEQMKEAGRYISRTSDSRVIGLRRAASSSFLPVRESRHVDVRGSGRPTSTPSIIAPVFDTSQHRR